MSIGPTATGLTSNLPKFDFERELLHLIEQGINKKEAAFLEANQFLQTLLKDALHDENQDEPRREKITMSVITTNDNAVRLKPSAQDRDGVAIPVLRLELTVDKPDVASITADPDVPGAFVISALPASDPNVGSRTVVVTTTDSESGVSTTTAIEFDPGAEQTISVAAEVLPLTTSTGGTVAQGAPGDQSTTTDQTGTGDQTGVTA